MEKPTLKMMSSSWEEEDDAELTHEVDEVIGTIRNGTEHSFVASKADSEGNKKYWQVIYRSQADGEYNDFRDGDLNDSDVHEVVPVEKKIITWKNV